MSGAMHSESAAGGLPADGLFRCDARRERVASLGRDGVSPCAARNMRALPWIAHLALAGALLFPATARAGDEDAFLSFWNEHQAVVSNPAAATAVCDRFLAGAPSSAYRPAVAALNAWHALAAGRTNAAHAGFTALLDDSAAPVAAAAGDCARRWLTRLDREHVRAALTVWYARHVAYPPSLDPMASLPATVRPPLRDRWNESWD